ncbi:MAG: S41 family peptidase, partial [Patescibacteria group bacterium]
MKNFLDFLNRGTTYIVAISLIVGAFAFGVFIGRNNTINPIDQVSLLNKEEGKPSNVDFSLFWRTWNILNEKFVSTSTSTDHAVTDQEKVWGAISGLASSLGDPYTVFLPPVENEIFETSISGNFEGVGMEIGIRDGVLTVVSPLKNTPAYKAGILAQDKIIAIDDVTTAHLSIDEAIKKIRGERGTKVKFTIVREGAKQPLEISVVRDVIDIPTLDTELRSDGIFVLQLYNFSAVSPNLFRNALREFILSGSHRLILDLRGNPGGFLEAAVDMASWFLPAGKVVAIEDYGGNEEQQFHRSKGYDIFNKNLKLIILLNQGSASASEILAGALREHGIATIVGEKSFGKGSVQELVPITTNTSLKVTVARWLTPNGISISVNGLTPDTVVPVTPEDIEKGKDPQLQKA